MDLTLDRMFERSFAVSASFFSLSCKLFSHRHCADEQCLLSKVVDIWKYMYVTQDLE